MELRELLQHFNNGDTLGENWEVIELMRFYSREAYTDFGKNITIGNNVFINADCKFQDQGGIFIDDGALIGHGVVLATLDHDLAPSKRQQLHSIMKKDACRKCRHLNLPSNCRYGRI